MKKVFLAVLAIAAMMVSCQKEGLVDNQKETPEVEVNEPQPVILGSNLFKAPTTKASIDDINSWKDEGKYIYVYAINNNPADGAVKVPIDNVGAQLKENSDTDDLMKGSLDLKDSDGKPFYYGASDDDIYDFYGYYLGYNLGGEVETAAAYENDAITVSNVNVLGSNDIMIASTDKTKDAIVGGTMVNPKYLYSQYSARHGVTPNLVFNHMLSKFSFNVRYAGNLVANSKIELTDIKFVNVQNSGTLTVKGETGFEATGEAVNEISLNLQEAITLNSATEAEGQGYLPAGELMVVPVASESLVIKFKQTFNIGTEEQDVKEFFLEKTITPTDVVDAEGQQLSATSFEKGKHYVVNITVYGLEAVQVNVQLIPWEAAGTITIDPDQKEDGVYQYVVATKEDTEGTLTLFAKQFVENEVVYTDFEGTKAGAGTYTLDDASKAHTNIVSITVGENGVITSVIQAEPEN